MTKIIGLTGGIGSGKTTVANFFKEKGVPVYIADDEAKKIMDYNEVIAEVQQLFEEKVIDNFGKLDRKKISQIVFHNKEKLNALNALIHPKVKAHFNTWLEKHASFSFVIKEVAILFETNGHLYCDATILVTAPIEIRVERVMKRDHKTREEVLQVINNQMPEEEKIKLATYVVENEKLEKTHKQVEIILQKLKFL
ncbi:Dephospho-CoA kinase [Flavobacterium indicum GPTSA100-9 = DSM 17447]|uniref:Dephospho-CoA kinase n=1 Tax=Flavobacterium indicum (strain DSM 17447 / CIP 109464 / GPTSA100-9) TaxID=1094466 RepID=H8XUM7_FLAIG|nr:dephospho-CoA kinase [Flavobacterium indicum]CCG53805.1 Dephospho-CoA kinase [Flavobacterium indicum GPTSA100-9 = DSM 17447]